MNKNLLKSGSEIFFKTDDDGLFNDSLKYFEEADITVIRPLIYIPEKDIIGFQNKMKFDSVKNPCPFDKNTKRESVKKLLHQIQKENPNVREKMFNAILKGKIYQW